MELTKLKLKKTYFRANMPQTSFTIMWRSRGPLSIRVLMCPNQEQSFMFQMVR